MKAVNGHAIAASSSLASDIAAEHCEWARRDGMTPREVLHTIGIAVPTGRVSWEEVRHALMRKWLAIRGKK